jgi:uncharacterized membrane protein YsdA (DUF1294 family)
MQTPYLLVFVSSLSVLSFEILLIRIFTIRLSYHYASLIISLSMAGLVMGSLLAFLRQRMSQLFNFSDSQFLPYLAAALAISYPSVFLLLSVIPLDHVRMLWEDIQIVYLVFFILLCTVPFFFYGLFISLALTAWREKATMIYASDLIGGAAGLLVVIVLMNSFSIEYVLIILTVAVSPVILSALNKTTPRIFLGFIILACCLLVGFQILPLKISPYKGLMQALKDDDARHVTTIYSSHSRLDLFENPRMKFAPGLSLTFTDHVPKGIGMALDGEIVGVVMDGKESDVFNFLPYLPSALPYLLAKPKDVVIIASRNSADLLQARHFGARNVFSAENDASILKSYRSQQEDRGLSSVHIFPGSGRNLLKNLHKGLGLIFLSKTGFFPSGSFGLQEDYDVTVEAIETYMESLKDDGILFIQMFLLPPPRLELRLAKNIGAALIKMGIQEIHTRLLIYRSWDTVNFIIKRNGFSGADLREIRQFLMSRQFDLLYPAISGQEKFITGLDYQGLFSQVLNNELSVDFESSYPFDIRETTDDRPFFHYFLKLGKIGEIYALSGKKWAYFLHEGMFLPFILIFLILLALCIFLLVFLVSKASGRNTEHRTPNAKLPLMAYCSLIGFAFMFIEVFFIHRLILSFGSPVKAFSITLVTILLSAGLGSLASGRITLRKLPWIMGLAPLLVVACYFLFDLFDETPASITFMVPIGIILGFFFPVGLRLLTNEETDGVPLAYAANGAASIIAPSLASLVAVAYGCSVLLILAAILYTLAIIIIFPVVLRVS